MNVLATTWDQHSSKPDTGCRIVHDAENMILYQWEVGR